jgi:hypothetical protein
MTWHHVPGRHHLLHDLLAHLGVDLFQSKMPLLCSLSVLLECCHTLGMCTAPHAGSNAISGCSVHHWDRCHVALFTAEDDTCRPRPFEYSMLVKHRRCTGAHLQQLCVAPANRAHLHDMRTPSLVVHRCLESVERRTQPASSEAGIGSRICLELLTGISTSLSSSCLHMQK